MRRFAIAALLVAGVLATGPAAYANTLRWASQGDFLTMDPHAQNESLNNTASAYIYEPLITYNEKFELVPALATTWTRDDNLLWKFNLCKGVKFHDGTPFTADEVVFTIERAMSPTSNFRVYTTNGRIRHSQRRGGQAFSSHPPLEERIAALRARAKQ